MCLPVNTYIVNSHLTIKEAMSKIIHTCDDLLLALREIWISFQGDWSPFQGDFSTADLACSFMLFHDPKSS